MECPYCQTSFTRLRSHVLSHYIPFYLQRAHAAALLFASVVSSRPGRIRGLENLELLDTSYMLHFTIYGPRQRAMAPGSHNHVLTATRVWFEEGPEQPKHPPCVSTVPATELVLNTLGRPTPNLRTVLFAWNGLPCDPEWVCSDTRLRYSQAPAPMTPQQIVIVLCDC